MKIPVLPKKCCYHSYPKSVVTLTTDLPKRSCGRDYQCPSIVNYYSRVLLGTANFSVSTTLAIER